MPSSEVLILILLALLAFYLISKLLNFLSRFFTSRSTRIGIEGEKKVSKLLKKAFRKVPHHQYDNIILESGNDMTQIDHVVISVKGIYVVETKNLEGWIFGNEHNKMWTQSLYGNNYKFINPLRQNYKHIKMLEEILGLNREKFESIIVFTEYGEFKTDMPYNVIYSTQLVKFVKSHNILKLDQTALDLFADKLEEFILDNSKKNIRRHKKHVRSIIKKKM